MLRMNAFCLITLLALTGCGSGSGEYRQLSDKDAADTPPVADSHHHDHGPNGGHVIELGDHHGEVTLAANRKLTLHILDGALKNAVPLADATAVANLKIGGETTQVALVAAPLDGETDGKTSRFQSAEPLPETVKDLEDVGGDVTLTIGGKATTGAIEHHHH